MKRHAYVSGLLLVVGCASPMKALREDNKRLTQTVTELRGERRAQDRKLRDLQHQLDAVRAQIVTSTLDSMPSLPVEVAAPDREPSSGDARVVGVTEDGEEIVYEGDAAAGRAATLDDDPPRSVRSPSRAREQVASKQPAVAPRRVRATPRDVPTDRSPEAASEYRLAVELVTTGRYDDGITALRGFLKKHARHDYADNAQYWLGEAYYARKEYPHALTEFRAVIETYPRGNKVPDALLKVGYCYQAMGQSEKARAVLEQVVNLYPKTEPAALAAKRLETP